MHDLQPLLNGCELNIYWRSDADIDLGEGKTRGGIYSPEPIGETEFLAEITRRRPEFARVTLSKLFQADNGFEVESLAKEIAEKTRSAGCSRVIVTTAHGSGIGYIYDTAKHLSAATTTDH